MSHEEQQLRRKLTGLRISQAHIRNALMGAGRGTFAKPYRKKLKHVKEAAAKLAEQLERLEDEKAKAQSPLRSPQSVLDHHLRAFDSGKVETILSDYAKDAVLLTPEGTFRGHKESVRSANPIFNLRP